MALRLHVQGGHRALATHVLHAWDTRAPRSAPPPSRGGQKLLVSSGNKPSEKAMRVRQAVRAAAAWHTICPCINGLAGRGFCSHVQRALQTTLTIATRLQMQPVCINLAERLSPRVLLYDTCRSAADATGSGSAGSLTGCGSRWS